MSAALRFRSYRHWETHVLSDEDRVLGVEPAGQEEDTCRFTDAHKEFREAAAKVSRIIGLIFQATCLWQRRWHALRVLGIRNIAATRPSS